VLRTRVARAAVVAVAAALALATSPPAATSGARGPALFDYDHSAPLEVTWGKTVVSHDIAHQDLKFSPTRRARVAAYFVHPRAGAPWPLVIWTPGRGEDRSKDIGDADALARKGVASLLVDPPAPEVVTCDAAKDLAIFTRYVVGRRRAVDLALTLPDVDGERIAAAGFSYGASVTAVLAGVEHRIRAFALKSGRAHHTGFMRLACPQLSPKKLAAYVEKLSVVDPISWVPKARPLQPESRRARPLPGSTRTKGAAFLPGRPPAERGGDRISRPVAVASIWVKSARGGGDSQVVPGPRHTGEGSLFVARRHGQGMAQKATSPQ
jgi:Esterase FrsA-like